jgi:hypothetical protein
VYDMVRADQPQKDGTPLNRNTFRQTQADIRAYPIATGNSVTAGDVVDVVNGEVTRSVVAEANVKTRLFTGSTSSTATCRLNDKYSICVYCSIGTTQAYLVDNSSGNLVSTASLGLSAANNLCIARLSDTEFIVGCGYDNAGLTMLGTVSDTSISFGERVTGFGSGSVTVLVPLSSTKVFSLVSRPGGAVASCILTNEMLQAFKILVRSIFLTNINCVGFCIATVYQPLNQLAPINNHHFCSSSFSVIIIAENKNCWVVSPRHLSGF